MCESGTKLQDVFFDDLKIIHTPSPIIQEDHYYPYGLSMRGLEKQGSNPWKYNGVEEVSGLDLNFYSTFFRQYDPAIGRFSKIDPLTAYIPGESPYHFGFNNPVLYNDPLGLMGQVGPGSGNHWSDEYRDIEANAAIMSSSTFNRFYNITNSNRGSFASRLGTTYTNQGYYSYTSTDGERTWTNTGWTYDWELTVRQGNSISYRPNRLTSLSAKDLYGGFGITTGGFGTYYAAKGNITHNEFYWKQKNGKVRLRTATVKSNYVFNRSHDLVGKSFQGAKVAGRAFAWAGIGLSAYDIVLGDGLNLSNGLDVAFGFVGFIPGVGWAISGAYFVTNTAVTLYSGKTIGAHLEESFDN